MAIIEAKLHNEPILDLPNSTGLPVQALDPLSLQSTLAIMRALGRHKLASVEKSERKDAYRMVEAAEEALSNWPLGYHKFLNELGTRMSAAKPTVVGIAKQFSSFYSSLFRVKSCREGAGFLHSEFVRFGFTSWQKAVVDKKTLRGGEAGVEERFISTAKLAQRIGINVRTLRQWHQKGLLSMTRMTRIQSGKGVRYVWDSNASDLAKKASGKILQSRAAAASVELPFGVLSSLKASGHFAVTHMPRHRAGFHEADLRNFTERMLQKSSPIIDENLDMSSVISLRHILQTGRFGSTEHKAKFVAAYLDGIVCSIGRTGESLQDVLFRKDVVDKYVRKSRATALGDSLSRKEAAQAIGCDALAIPGLIQWRYLVEQTQNGVTRVRRESIEKFSADYVALSFLANQHGTSSRRLLQLCIKSGIKTTSIARRKRSSIPFIQRCDEQALVESIKENPTRVQKGEIWAREHPTAATRLKRYLERLRNEGASLPRIAGRPNKRVIAEACGMTRNVFYNNAEVASLLEAFEAEERLAAGIPKLDDLESLKRYLDGLRKSNDLIPRRNHGRPNKVAIARACGFRRNIFYSNPEMVAVLEAADADERSRNMMDPNRSWPIRAVWK